MKNKKLIICTVFTAATILSLSSVTNVEANSTQTNKGKVTHTFVKGSYTNKDNDLKYNGTFTTTNSKGIKEIVVKKGQYPNTNEIVGSASPSKKGVTSLTYNVDFRSSGVYTFFITDVNGNVDTKTYTIKNDILGEKVKPLTKKVSVSVNKNKTEGTLRLQTSDNAGIREIFIMQGDNSVDKISTMGKRIYTSSGKLERAVTSNVPIISNGTYTVYVKDVNGNELLQKITVLELEKTPPVITITPSTTKVVKDKVKVNVGVTDNNQIAYKRLAYGKFTIQQMKNKAILPGTYFEATENGTYTIYAIDRAGNESVKTINITNIDKENPQFVKSSYNAKTKVVTITAKDDKGVQSITFNGQTVTNKTVATFKVTKTGSYNVTIKDVSGRTTTKAINVK